MPTAADRGAADERARDDPHTKTVVAHARLILATLHEHHESEDELLWPLLHAKVPMEELVRTVERQHHVVAELIAQVELDLDRWVTVADDGALRGRLVAPKLPGGPHNGLIRDRVWVA